MNYANIDYKAIEVNPLTKAEIKFSKEYRKVPIAIIDGDQIIAMLAKRWKTKKILKGGVIGTLMSNYGLEKFLKKDC